MNAKENALRIIHFDHPERVVTGCPTHAVAYRGCNHEGYTGGGHHLPVGSRWTDIWGTTWHREHDGVMGFPRGNPLADLVDALPSYIVGTNLLNLSRKPRPLCGGDLTQI